MKGFTTIELLIIIAIAIVLSIIPFLITEPNINEGKSYIDEIEKCKKQLKLGEMCVYQFDNETSEIYIDEENWG